MPYPTPLLKASGSTANVVGIARSRLTPGAHDSKNDKNLVNLTQKPIKPALQASGVVRLSKDRGVCLQVVLLKGAYVFSDVVILQLRLALL